jgi:hypothetical protein
MTDSEGTQTIEGSVSFIQHNRNNKGGGSAEIIGGSIPEGLEVIVGGTPAGGEEIGDDPDFRWPTAHSGSWNNAQYVYDKVDGTYGSTSVNSATHNFTNYNWAISGNTIGGVVIKLELSGSTAAGSVGVALSWDGGTSWTDTKTTPTLTTSDTVVTLGSISDKWGRASWSVGDFTNGNFKVRLTSNLSSNTVQVDAVQVQVYHYTTGGGAGGGGDI